MSEQDTKNKMTIPGFRGSKPIELNIDATKEAEARFIESKDVNPITYNELEYVFGASYNELKRHHSTVTYQLVMADKALEQTRATILLDKYPEFMKDKAKSQDNADMRKAFMMRDPEYLEALDRIAMLKAVESFIDGRIKVLENISRYMKKRMDLIIRSGLTNDQLYVTSGGKKNG